jgi:hypothetical protein
LGLDELRSATGLSAMGGTSAMPPTAGGLATGTGVGVGVAVGVVAGGAAQLNGIALEIDGDGRARSIERIQMVQEAAD